MSSNFELLTSDQLKSLSALKSWISVEAKFKSRSDEDFLLLFLRSCEFDLELTKRTLTLYYDSRRTVPRWWCNRDLNDPKLRSLIELRFVTTLIDKDDIQPTIAIATFSRYGPDLNNFDDYGKLIVTLIEVIVRRRNCQMNGLVVIADCRDFPTWIMWHLMWPSAIKNSLQSFYTAMPVRIKKMIFLNSPNILYSAYQLIASLFSKTFLEKVHFLRGSSEIGDHVSLELLPEEYGGQNKSLRVHDDFFFKEVLDFSQYLEEDKNYGF